MSDLEAIQGVAAASVEAVNGVAKASVEAVNGVEVVAAATGASRFVNATGGGFIATAANSDRTNWSTYDGTDSSSPKAFSLAFGRNANGQGVYVCTRDAASREIQISGTDVTTDAVWTDINISPNDKQYKVAWGAKSGTTAGVWMSVGDDGLVMRSTDGGANWSAVDMSSTNLGSKVITNIATNGQGKWMFFAGSTSSAYMFVSTDDGASFSQSLPFDDNDEPQSFEGLVYTNSTWIVAYSRQSEVNFRSCADSDTSDWGSEFRVNSTNFPDRNIGSNNSAHSVTFANPSQQTQFIRMAAANSKVCAVSTADEVILTFSANGKVLNNGQFVDGNASGETKLSIDGGDTCMDVCTDGSTWLVSCKGGDVHESTDNADSWTRIVNDLSISGTQYDLNAITCDVVLPL